MSNQIITHSLYLCDQKIIVNEEGFEVINGVKTYVYHVSREFEPVKCPKCNSTVSRIKEYVQRKIKHFDEIGYPILIIYKQRRFVCPVCGKTTGEYNGLINKGNNLSNYLNQKILEYCRYKISFTTIAKILNVSIPTVINSFMEVANFNRRELTDIICIDEFRANIDKINKYAFIIGDPLSAEILDILPSRMQNQVEAYFHTIPKEERYKVLYVNMDMWEPYRASIHFYFPKAKIAIDSFHWIRASVMAFNAIRIKVMNSTTDKAYSYLLKKHHHTLIMHEGELPRRIYNCRVLNKKMTCREIIEFCINKNSELEKAWELLQDLYRLRDRSNEKTAPNNLTEWIKQSSESGLSEFASVADTYNNWFVEISNSFIVPEILGKRLSNSFIEGMNRHCKEIKALGCGFNNFWIYRARILYTSMKTPLPFRKDIEKNGEKYKKNRRPKSRKSRSKGSY